MNVRRSVVLPWSAAWFLCGRSSTTRSIVGENGKGSSRMTASDARMAKFEIAITEDYWPVADLFQGAMSLRQLAKVDPRGSRWKYTGALLLQAAVVEAF